jgi:hypothetical protein
VGVLGTDDTTPDWRQQANSAAGVNVPPGGGMTAGPTTEPPVLWGYEQVRQQLAREPGGAGEGRAPALGPAVKAPKWKTADEATLDIYTWSDRQLDNLGNRLVNAGLLSKDYSRADLITAWGGLVKQSQAFTAAGKPRTPWDVISWMGSGQSGPAEPKTRIEKQINISGPEQARAILRDVLSARIGRMVSEDEVDDFQAGLNQMQRANPLINTTTYDDGQATTTTTGGVDPQEFADQYATKHYGAEAGHYDTVARLMPAFYDVMFNPVG